MLPTHREIERIKGELLSELQQLTVISHSVAVPYTPPDKKDPLYSHPDIYWPDHPYRMLFLWNSPFSITVYNTNSHYIITSPTPTIAAWRILHQAMDSIKKSTLSLLSSTHTLTTQLKAIPHPSEHPLFPFDDGRTKQNINTWCQAVDKIPNSMIPLFVRQAISIGSLEARRTHNLTQLVAPESQTQDSHSLESLIATQNKAIQLSTYLRQICSSLRKLDASPPNHTNKSLPLDQNDHTSPKLNAAHQNTPPYAKRLTAEEFTLFINMISEEIHHPNSKDTKPHTHLTPNTPKVHHTRQSNISQRTLRCLTAMTFFKGSGACLQITVANCKPEPYTRLLIMICVISSTIYGINQLIRLL
jgi:hypothetical protein